MNKDRVIILICLAGMVASLTCASLLMPRIREARSELQLVYADDSAGGLGPKDAILYAALGSLRGVFVDILWARANELKRQGKYFDAMWLSQSITRLQPRFPQVWEFQAWNMAYNISVATYTPEERWMWVQNGVRLLRDEAIPRNPRAVRLYKELAWFHLHKIGQYSDDMHWYYKQQFALQWHLLLGAPPEAGGPEAMIAAFEPIVRAYDQYINPSRHMIPLREELDRIIESHPALVNELRPLSYYPLDLFRRRLAQRLEEIERQDRTAGEALAKLLSRAEAVEPPAPRDPMLVLASQDSEVAKLLDQVRFIGFEPDERLLNAVSMSRAMAAVEAGSQDGGPAVSAEALMGGTLPEQLAKLRQWLADASIEPQRQRLLAFLRARTLAEQYHMDPHWMLELMRGRWLAYHAEAGTPGENAADTHDAAVPLPLPIDWRHPAAHGLYWASLGVRKVRETLAPDEFDILNTDRLVLHALQALTHTGQLVFDPLTGYYDQLPHTGFVMGYHRALYGAPYRITDDRLLQSAAPDTFKAGHENFLIWAVVTFYLYGSQEEAQQWYDTLRREYSFRQADRVARYQQPLSQFVTSSMLKGIDSVEDATAAVTGYLVQSIAQGQAIGRPQVALRYYRIAQTIYEDYQSRQDVPTPGAIRNRMALARFDDLRAEAMIAFLRNGTYDWRMKARVWLGSELPIRQAVYDRVKPLLVRVAEAARLDTAVLFPEPPGMADYRKLHPPAAPEEPADGDKVQGESIVK